jgi:membrane associated rhomboid family serine protease
VAAGLVAAHGWIATRGGAGGEADLVALGALERSRVWAGELWRFAVGPFLQPDLGGLALEVVGVLVAGTLVERRLSRTAFLSIYVASAVGGSAVALLGRDAVVVGSFAGVLGLGGALGLVLARSLNAERTLAIRLGALAVALVGDTAAPALVSARSGWDLVSAGSIAQVGGLLAGWAVALPFAAPLPRWRARLHGAAAAAALAAGILGASWPRAGRTFHEEDQLIVRVHAALKARDLPEARRLVADAEQQGFRSDGFTLYRAIVRAAGGEGEAALALLRPLQQGEPGPVRDEANRQIARLAHELGHRYYTGDGRPLAPLTGLHYFDEACRAGNAEACGNAGWIRSGTRPDAEGP